MGHRDPDADQVPEPTPDDLGVVPKRLPEELLHFMRTRGAGKVIFASDWPVLRQHRVVPEAKALDLPPEVLDNYLYRNAEQFFFESQEQ